MESFWSSWFLFYVLSIIMLGIAIYGAHEYRLPSLDNLTWFIMGLSVIVVVVSFWHIEWWCSLLVLPLGYGVGKIGTLITTPVLGSLFATSKIGTILAGIVSMALMVISLVALCNI